MCSAALILSLAGYLDFALTSSEALMRLLYISLTAAAVIAVVITVAAVRFTDRLLGPLDSLDIDDPERIAEYDELARLFNRMKQRNLSVASRLAAARRGQIEFAAIVSHMREGLVIVDKDGRVVTCNNSARLLLGSPAPADGAIRLGALELCRDRRFWDSIQSALSGVADETRLNAGGRCIQLFANAVADAGENAGAVIMILDITEQEERERLRREFSANVSHELKTPLAVISGYAEIMAAGIAQAEDSARFADKIFAEAQKLVATVDDIIELSKLDENAAPDMEPVDLAALAEETAARLAESAAARHIAVTAETSEAVIPGMRGALEQLAYNLLDNAIKYNVDGGAARISVSSPDGAVVLEVADTGVGIPPSERERVFERFYRADKSRGGAGGTGLGLAIVKHAAALHGAAIEITSDERYSTIVRVAFPPSQTRAVRNAP